MLGIRIARERERHPDPTGSPMGMPIRQEPGNRGKTPDRAVGSPGHLGHLTVGHLGHLTKSLNSRVTLGLGLMSDIPGQFGSPAVLLGVFSQLPGSFLIGVSHFSDSG